MASSSDNGTLGQAEEIWNRLDDLANSDPEAYKKFIEKQMEERKIYFSIPEPHCAISTKFINKPDQVFINICGWQKIPYPETDTEPIKLMAGFKQSTTLKSGVKQHIFPVAVNDKILKECFENSTDEKQLINLIIELIENQFKIKLSHSFKKCSQDFVGEKYDDMRKHFLKDIEKNPEDVLNSGETINSPKDILKHLHGGNEEQSNTDMNFVKENFDNLIGSAKSKQETPLISVMQDGVEQVLPEPVYTLNESDDVFEVRIELPSVTTVAECDLDLTEDEIELTVENKFYLKLNLSKKIHNETSKAKYIKKKQTLSLVLPIQ